MSFLQEVHESWLEIFTPHSAELERIERDIGNDDFNPEFEKVMRAFQSPLDDVNVVIFGQDPYPTKRRAVGLAFSVGKTTAPLPKSLTNIFVELRDDLGGPLRSNGDLSSWGQQGVALVNRILTVPTGNSGGHKHLGWQRITDSVAKNLGERGVVPILWGSYAQELNRFFEATKIISSPHPSPLSAYRGFFGSKPFSRANQFLAEMNKQEIDWLRE